MTIIYDTILFYIKSLYNDNPTSLNRLRNHLS